MGHARHGHASRAFSFIQYVVLFILFEKQVSEPPAPKPLLGPSTRHHTTEHGPTRHNLSQYTCLREYHHLDRRLHRPVTTVTQ